MPSIPTNAVVIFNTRNLCSLGLMQKREMRMKINSESGFFSIRCCRIFLQSDDENWTNAQSGSEDI